MDISTAKWNEIVIDEIATLIYSVKPAEMKSREATIERLQNWRQEVEDSSVMVLARTKGALIGMLFLSRMSPTTMEINPGALGGHPLVLAGHSPKEVGANLIKEAIAWSRKEGYQFLEIWLQRDREEDPQLSAEYQTWYGSLGFFLEGTSVDMVCYLSEQAVVEISMPAGFRVKPVMELSEDALYQCYYAAFNAGEAQFFFHQSEEERRAYFNTLGIRGSLNDEASLALMKEQQIVGFTFALPYGKGNLHLSCNCIHPEFGQQGYGKLLLRLTMKKAAQLGMRTMTLFTDTEIRAYELYRKNGWREKKYYLKYRWSAGTHCF
ncbi:MAG: GNAT family N-acetyltransferase [Candidatus Thorarchaeota archaeon]